MLLMFFWVFLDVRYVCISLMFLVFKSFSLLKVFFNLLCGLGGKISVRFYVKDVLGLSLVFYF